MYCTECGAKNTPDSHFCRECGHKFEVIPHKISEEEYDRALPEDERVSALLERAYRFRKSGELSAVIALCQEAIAIKPDSAAAHSMLGQIYDTIGDKEKAILEYETIVLMNPGSVADRLKLDQLKGSGSQVVQQQAPPRAVFVDHTAPNRSFTPAPLLLAGGAFGLVLISAAVGYMLRSSTAENKPISPGKDRTEQRVAQKLDNNALPLQPANPVPVTSPGSYGQQPIFVYPPIQPQPKIVYVPTPGGKVSGIKTDQSGTRVGVRTANNRVYLPLDPPDEITPSRDGKITITVPPADLAKQPKPDPNDANSRTNIQISSPIKPSSGTNSSNVSSAQPFLMMGNQLKMQEKYPQAIDAYKKALAVSGDGSADVNQKIAYCYQLSGKKQSARTYYQSAIDSYRQLEKEGRLTDAGRNGLKASETGMKLCE